jgi:hypothetical protein
MDRGSNVAEPLRATAAEELNPTAYGRALDLFLYHAHSEKRQVIPGRNDEDRTKRKERTVYIRRESAQVRKHARCRNHQEKEEGKEETQEVVDGAK